MPATLKPRPRTAKQPPAKSPVAVEQVVAENEFTLVEFHQLMDRMAAQIDTAWQRRAGAVCEQAA